MSLWGLILKNLWRQRVRNGLTLLGVGIGVATILALGLLMNGFESSLGATLRAGKTDFSVMSADASTLLFSSITEADLNAILQFAGVERAVGSLLTLSRLLSNPYFFSIGVNSQDLDFLEIEVTSGRPFKADASDELILGRTAASNGDIQLGDVVTLGTREFKVVGIFESGNVWEDGGAFLSLKAMQEWQHREGEVSIIAIKVQSGFDAGEVADSLRERFAGKLVTMRSLAESQNYLHSVGIMQAVSWAVSVLAVGIGGIGVMNTMTMAVFERTREIGILRAIGWKRRRILALVMGESLTIALVAAVLGFAGGLAAVQGILLLPWIKGYLAPVYSLPLFAQAFSIAIIVGLLGGLYPAYRATKILPTTALRYE